MAVEDRAWSWRHGKKAQVGGKVCVCNSQRLLLAADETKNDHRSAAQQLRRGACFVIMLCDTDSIKNNTGRDVRTILEIDLGGRKGSTTSSFLRYKKGTTQQYF